MSWLVQTLLRSSMELRETQDLENEPFTDLLVIEDKIAEMKREGLLSQKDIDLIENISDGKPLSDAGDKAERSRQALARQFYAICDRIAYSLGGEFTDEGYITYMQKKHKLTYAQVEKMKKYMKGRYRYKIMRKLIK